MLLTEYNKSVLNVTYMSLSATEMLYIIYHHIFKYKYTTKAGQPVFFEDRLWFCKSDDDFVLLWWHLIST